MNPIITTINDAEFVIIGGGAIGAGVAYALTRAGKKDILLLERAPDLAQATTSQGAGLCGQVRDSAERTKLAMKSVEVFRELQRDPEVTPDWHETGSLRLALSSRRAEEFQRLKNEADEAGLECSLIDNAEAKRLWPAMNFAGVRSVLWCPSDGWMTPQRVVGAYAHQCRKAGVRIATNCLVEGIEQESGRVSAVRTNQGTVNCRYVVNAAGAHAYHVAKMAGLELPIVPVRHEYFITIPAPELSNDLPCFRVPELTLYGRVRDGGLLLGGWEPEALRTDPRTYPLEGQPPEITPDQQVLQTFEKKFSDLFPSVATLKKARIGKGWPTFTPDGRFIIGESSKVKGFVMAGGCNAHGISGSGGIGHLFVESLLNPNPSPYVRSLSPDRFSETSWTWEQACRDAARVYETYYGTDVC
jgi:glycine/D-amino acid oxidase-like deaminating enzyme